MLPRSNGAVWMDGDEEEASSSWTKTTTTANNNNDVGNNKAAEEEDMAAAMGGVVSSFSSFKSMLEGDWYMGNPLNNIHGGGLHGFSGDHSNLLLQPIDSSASCSPSQPPPPFPLDQSQQQHPHSFLPPKSCYSSLLNFDNGGFDLSACESSGFLLGPASSNSPVLMGFAGLNNSELSSSSEFGTSTTRFLPPPPPPPPLSSSDPAAIGGYSPADFEGFDNVSANSNNMFLNRAKVLRPLEVFPPVGAQPTLFQKRAAALRQNFGGGDSVSLGNLEVSGLESSKRRKRSEYEGEIEEASLDISGLNYDSDEGNEYSKAVEENAKSNSNANSTVTGGVDQKGKKKGLPAKNLMAERRRRKKLNDRLYMLRSVVPKISKMDRASILGDAIDYLKELLQRINDLHNELESTPPGSLLPPSTSFHPLTPTPPTLPCRVKEELFPGSLPSPKNQPARVEVRLREGRAVNIHMFCARRPGLLLSTMRALDNLGLDIQQAVISCFNGFALDVFRAEQCREGQEVLPEQIKAVLLDSAGFHGMM